MHEVSDRQSFSCLKLLTAASATQPQEAVPGYSNLDQRSCPLFHNNPSPGVPSNFIPNNNSNDVNAFWSVHDEVGAGRGTTCLSTQSSC